MTASERPSTASTGRLPRLMSRVPPWLTLLLLAPVLGELISGHQAPLEFFNPLNFLLLSLPYGCGALICRELMIRWGGGALCLLLLGIAYGVFEEGIVVYSLFDPQWSELGAMAEQGYYGGVNWTWTAGTVQFHALVSVGASVALAQVIHADRKSQPWLGKWGWVACIAVLIAWIGVLGYIMHTSMHRPFPPLGLYALAWVTVAVLGWAAYRVAKRRTRSTETKQGKPWYFFLVGCANISLLFIGVYMVPEFAAPPLALTMLAIVLLDAISLWLLWRWSGHWQAWDDRHRLALVAGILAFFVFFSFVKDFETWQGASLVGVLTVFGLWRVGRIVRERLGVG